MKNTAIIVLLSMLMAFTNNAYDRAMTKSMVQLHEASTSENFRAVANSFDRIADKEKNKWLPYYYSAYAKTILASVEHDLSNKDVILDEAQRAINLLKKIEHNQVEVLTLEAFLNMIRISVDPANRGQEFSMKSAALLEEATAIDPDNPRTMLFMAHLLYGSAQFFKADTTEACEKFTRALALFDADEGTPKHFWPAWGKDQALSMVKQCEG